MRDTEERIYIGKFLNETTKRGLDLNQLANFVSQYDEMKMLLERASGKLQDYCSDLNGDMNDSLSDEIDNLFRK